ncbi:MAG: L-2-hydroxyglutarate oxidase [Chloroflexi bacterium]|nr:L-2-hydroxyglutarate oxidase [Chloroflexota bacterium]|tara:strand:- start:9565 stop:10779 length:1215 start_codon:yes stop_codon:yes gene_type:complete
MTSKKVDITIIGGGILGLSTAMQLSKKLPDSKIVVLEKEDKLAVHQTGHNSGVIHSGLYYRPGSQKASFCVDGASALRAFCDENSIPYDLVGKLVVATNEDELGRLDTLLERGQANGVQGIRMIGPEEIIEIEPHVTSGVRAIHCPMTGIIDYTLVTNTYAKIFQNNNGEIFLSTKVVSIGKKSNVINIQTNQGDFETKYIINCAGLYADSIARKMGIDPGIRIIPFRGEYFTLAENSTHLVKGLIYPVPDPAFPFLGVHYTRMINGGVEAGPNAVLAFAQEGYSKTKINISEFISTLLYSGFWVMTRKYWKTGMQEMYRSFSKDAFTKSLQKLLPEVKKSDLVPSGAGVRAQAVDRTGFLLDDFHIVETDQAIHVQNAPSPAATSSLGIGNHITNIALKNFDL